MTRTFRVLIFLYAIAMVIQAAGSLAADSSSITYWESWTESGATSVAYLVLALGYLLSGSTVHEPPRHWLAVAVGVTLTYGVGILHEHRSGEDFEHFLLHLGYWGTAIVFTVASVGVYFSLRKEKYASNLAACRKLVLVVWIGGASLVFSSLFLKLTDDGTGWAVLLRKEPWITHLYNVAGSWSGPGIDWLQTVYGPFGYIVYLLSLAATLAMAVWLSFFFVSFRHLQSSRLLACFAAVFNFLVFWVYTDIFWGWHFLVPESTWSAYLGSALWLAAPVFVLVLLVPVALRQGETWRLGTLLILQLPVAAFDYLCMPLLFFQGAVYLPGLGILMIGLQLESWACLGLLVIPVTESAPAVRE